MAKVAKVSERIDEQEWEREYLESHATLGSSPERLLHQDQRVKHGRPSTFVPRHCNDGIRQLLYGSRGVTSDDGRGSVERERRHPYFLDDPHPLSLLQLQ